MNGDDVDEYFQKLERSSYSDKVYGVRRKDDGYMIGNSLIDFDKIHFPWKTKCIQ